MGKQQSGHRREAAKIVFKVQMRPVGDSPPHPRKANVCPHLGWPRREMIQERRCP